MKLSIASTLLAALGAASSSSVQRELQNTPCLVLGDILFRTSCTGASTLEDFQQAMSDVAACAGRQRNSEAKLATGTANIAAAKAALMTECRNDRVQCIPDLSTLDFPDCEKPIILTTVAAELTKLGCDHNANVELMLQAGTSDIGEAKAASVEKCLPTLTSCLGSLDNLDLTGTKCTNPNILTTVSAAVATVSPTCTHSVNREMMLLTGESTKLAAKKFLVEKCVKDRQACTSWTDAEIPTCSANQVFKAIKQQLQTVQCNHGLNAEINVLFGTDSREEAEDAVNLMCDYSWDFSAAPTSTFQSIDAAMDSTFMTDYTNGDTFLNIETGNFRGADNPQFPRSQYDSRTRAVGQSIRDFRRGSAKSSVLGPVPELETCANQAMMCCFKRDRQSNDDNGDCADNNCEDQGPGDNSQLCDVADGDQGNVHCHGLAWDTNANSPSSTLKFNNLFFVSLFDHMYTRGYVENVLDAHPMCGCIESMPAVSRSDCTQIDVAQVFLLNLDANGYLEVSKKDDNFEIKFNACQGINPDNGESQSNDLAAHVNRLYLEGRISDGTQDVIDQTLVGGNNEACN